MTESSSRGMKQLRTIAAYALVVAIGASVGYIAFGLFGAAVGAALAIPVGIAIAALAVIAIGFIFLPGPDATNGLKRD